MSIQKIQKIPEKNTVLFVWFNQYSRILLKTSRALAIDPVEIKLQSQILFAQIIKELPRTACLIPEQNKVYQVSKRK